jgi:hypothetical protein
MEPYVCKRGWKGGRWQAGTGSRLARGRTGDGRAGRAGFQDGGVLPDGGGLVRDGGRALDKLPELQIEVDLPGSNGSDGLHEFGPGGALDNVAGRAGG